VLIFLPHFTFINLAIHDKPFKTATIKIGSVFRYDDEDDFVKTEGVGIFLKDHFTLSFIFNS
jgi:hypothetical protein